MQKPDYLEAMAQGDWRTVKEFERLEAKRAKRLRLIFGAVWLVAGLAATLAVLPQAATVLCGLVSLGGLIGVVKNIR